MGGQIKDERSQEQDPEQQRKSQSHTPQFFRTPAAKYAAR
jgi:hypothetical protein